MKKYFFYKNEITGFQEVENAVKIVETAAASHIHFLKNAVINLLNYEEAAKEIFSRFLSFYQNKDHPLLTERNIGPKALVVITGDKGLVGSLYHNLVNKVLALKTSYNPIWVVGAKGIAYFNEEKIKIEDFPIMLSGVPTPSDIKKTSDYFLNIFQEKGFQQIDILYSRFISIADQQSEIARLLPFDIGVSADSLKSGGAEGFPIFNPSKKAFFSSMLEKFINIFMARAILEAKLSEFSARTVTAENAIAQTRKLIDRLTLNFFKERRREFTQKQLESFIAHQIL